ncbi:hypothetical protein ACJIZ3_006326 [Penstemon smallii]|uniref:Uncharacterized protein n=1 Tax=Penstemon smallii TaxID=265156 RepID=A0ABD3S7K3_9LAMI
MIKEQLCKFFPYKYLLRFIHLVYTFENKVGDKIITMTN